MRNTFIDTLFDIAKRDKNVILMTGDLGFGVLTKFWETYPKQFINAGISEQNMTAMAAGMAFEGKTVFTYSIGNFPTLRCLEQIRNDVAYHRANVKIVAVGGGFAYGALGMSHHATEDIAIMRSLPELTVFTPCDPYETAAVTELAAQMDGPCYIRLGKGGEKHLHAFPVNVIIGKALPLREGNDTAILVAGAIAEEALEAAEILYEQGISCAVYSFPTVKPIDSETIRELAMKVDCIYTLEEHNIVGGFGSAVAEVMAEQPTKAILNRIGLNDEFSSIVGSQKYLRKQYGMNADIIVGKINKQYKGDMK
jgi:Transketolase, C-terminal subunit